jgi:hypothetical protein
MGGETGRQVMGPAGVVASEPARVGEVADGAVEVEQVDDADTAALGFQQG